MSVKCEESSTKNGIRVENDFEKNYPKNILLPMLEYLEEVGYRLSYEQCVGPRRELYAKNFVSLSDIYSIVEQCWFKRNISQRSLLTTISNKILLNCKIKKKLFHLLMLRTVLIYNFINEIDFKRRVSRNANYICKIHYPHDELFDHPNMVIYLVHLLRKVLLYHTDKKGYEELVEEFEKLGLEGEGRKERERWEDEEIRLEESYERGYRRKGSSSKESKNRVSASKGGKGKDSAGKVKASAGKVKPYGSKYYYKALVKSIVNIFSNRNIELVNLTDAFEYFQQTLVYRDKYVRGKYGLELGVPNWSSFTYLVVLRCLYHKRKEMKVTNYMVNEWVNEFKVRAVCVNNEETFEGSLEWVGAGQTLEGEKQYKYYKQYKQGKYGEGQFRTFTPIILSSHDYNFPS